MSIVNLNKSYFIITTTSPIIVCVYIKICNTRIPTFSSPISAKFIPLCILTNRVVVDQKAANFEAVPDPWVATSKGPWGWGTRGVSGPWGWLASEAWQAKPANKQN